MKHIRTFDFCLLNAQIRPEICGKLLIFKNDRFGQFGHNRELFIIYSAYLLNLLRFILLAGLKIGLSSIYKYKKSIPGAVCFFKIRHCLINN